MATASGETQCGSSVVMLRVLDLNQGGLCSNEQQDLPDGVRLVATVSHAFVCIAGFLKE